MGMDPKTPMIPVEEKTLELMATDGGITMESVSKTTGLSMSKTAAIIKGLRAAGRLERTGGKKGRLWIVK
ncbi:MAG: hypothetical protein LBB30_02200 [Candidatus Methanoplasma sp.]|jgi:DNA-binding IclR family transcriptional regulator|nr:hypothetical protein [Candidatus Methanoplasma sp.]